MANLNPIVKTTLSIALPANSPGSAQGTIVTPASMTDILAPGPNKSNRTLVLIDREFFEVLSITSTNFNANRGMWGSDQVAHQAGTLVWVGPEAAFSAIYQSEMAKGFGTYASQCVALDTVNPFQAIGTATIAAPNLRGGLIQGTPTAAATYTTDTAANIIADLLSFGVQLLSQGYEFTILNTSAGAFAITLAGGTGVTLVGGTLTVAQNAARRFRVVITGIVSPAVTIYQVS